MKRKTRGSKQKRNRKKGAKRWNEENTTSKGKKANQGSVETGGNHIRNAIKATQRA